MYVWPKPEFAGCLQPREATPTGQETGFGRCAGLSIQSGAGGCGTGTAALGRASPDLLRKSRPVRSHNRAHDVKSRASVRLGLLAQGVELGWELDAEGRSNALPLRLMSLLLALMDRLRSSIIFRAS
jgi:hypothetical protein